MPTTYLACEGAHDAALLGRFLQNGGFTPITSRNQVQSGSFVRYAPEGFPDNMIGRPPEPYFWQRLDHVVAVHPAGGDGALPAALGLVGGQVRGTLNNIGVFIDADNLTPAARMADLWAALIAKNTTPGFSFPGAPGTISPPPVRCGVYVLPDNVNHGSVEQLLHACAQTSYNDLHQKAGAYLADIDRTELTPKEQTRLAKGSNPQKAHLGVIGSVLRPGSAIANTIRDDRWIDPATLALPLIAPLRTFLRDLLNEPTI
jgi:hypothetical protein